MYIGYYNRDMNNESFTNYFTNIATSKKTLKFELVQCNDTKYTPENNKDIEYYQEMKKMIDSEHESFIEYSLSRFLIPVELLNKKYNAYLEYSKLKQKAKSESNNISVERNKLQEKINEINKDIRNLFDFSNIVYEYEGKKYANFLNEILLKKNILKLLNQKYIDDKSKLDVISYYEKTFTIYWGKYTMNRKNYYNKNGKDTGIPNRIVNENLDL